MFEKLPHSYSCFGFNYLQGLQLGPTEGSRYWVYWVPAQYVEAIKDAVFGVWQFF